MTEERRGRRPLSWLTTRTVESMDLDEILTGVDIDALVQRVDVDALLQQVDVERLLDRIDVNRLLDRVDADRLLDRVDPNRLLDRVDPNRLLDRVEPDRLMDRVDVDRLFERVDVAGLVDRAGVAEIVADSTGAVAGSVLDVARRQLVALDTIIERPLYRITGRDPWQRPTGPPVLAASSVTSRDGRARVTGSYAGPLSRTIAFVIDVSLVFWVYTLGAAGVSWVMQSLHVTPWFELDSAVVGAVVFLVWCFLYWFVGLALSGRTIGKALIGLKVLAHDGTPVTAGEAAVRTVLLPVSFVFLLGIIPVLFTARRSTLHDRLGRTCEVYDWGDRTAEMPAPLTAWLAKRADRINRPDPA